MNSFFAPLYEFFHYTAPFSDDLYEQEMYSLLAIIGIITSFFCVILFYYVINRPFFSRWYHWGIILLVNFVVAFIFGVVLPQNKFVALALPYTNEYYTFAFFHAIIVTIFYIILSFILRWGSSNAKNTPIPN